MAASVFVYQAKPRTILLALYRVDNRRTGFSRCCAKSDPSRTLYPLICSDHLIYRHARVMHNASRQPHGWIGVLYNQFPSLTRYHRPVSPFKLSWLIVALVLQLLADTLPQYTVAFTFIRIKRRLIFRHLGVSVRANKSLKSIELFINNQLNPANWERISEQGLKGTLNTTLWAICQIANVVWGDNEQSYYSSGIFLSLRRIRLPSIFTTTVIWAHCPCRGGFNVLTLIYQS